MLGQYKDKYRKILLENIQRHSTGKLPVSNTIQCLLWRHIIYFKRLHGW